MAWFGKSAPASSWRALFVGLPALSLLLAVNPVHAAQSPRLDAAAAGKILEDLRAGDLPGEYYWELEIHALPRRGAEKIYKGRLWGGGRNEHGTLKRIELTDGAGKKQRLLLQNGARPAVWRYAGNGVSVLGAADLFTPLLPDVELTAFDLQMPFLYWTNATLETVRQVRGRQAHVFVLRPPTEFASRDSRVAAVRIYVDEQLNALVQSELLDKDGRVLKRFSPISLKTIEKQPLPKAVDFRNEATGDKARLEMTAVALGLDHPPALFEPASLDKDIPPPVGKLTPID